MCKSSGFSADKQKVAVLGATGMVGRRLVSLLLNHPNFELTTVVGSGATTGVSYRTVWEEKETTLQQHYGGFWRGYPVPDGIDRMRISSFEELLRSERRVVFSSIPERAGSSKKS